VILPLTASLDEEPSELEELVDAIVVGARNQMGARSSCACGSACPEVATSSAPQTAQARKMPRTKPRQRGQKLELELMAYIAPR
jgi:hypothetical protein